MSISPSPSPSVANGFVLFVSATRRISILESVLLFSSIFSLLLLFLILLFILLSFVELYCAVSGISESRVFDFIVAGGIFNPSNMIRNEYNNPDT